MEINDSMTSMEIRLYMKDKGWQSKDNLTDMRWREKYGYGIWFERWDWHGIRVGKVCIHSHTSE